MWLWRNRRAILDALYQAMRGTFDVFRTAIAS